MKRSSTPLAIGAVIAVIAVAAVIAVLASGGDDGDVTSTGLSSPAGDLDAPAAAVISGDPLPPYAKGPDPAVGMSAPLVSGVDFDAAPVSLEPDGTTKVVVFLAHWCPHCQREVPVIQEWIDAGNLPDGAELVGVATAIDPDQANHPPDEWLDGEGWSSPVLVDTDNSVAQAMGLTGFPYWVVLDGDGSVLVRAVGELPMSDVEGWLAG